MPAAGRRGGRHRAARRGRPALGELRGRLRRDDRPARIGRAPRGDGAPCATLRDRRPSAQLRPPAIRRRHRGPGDGALLQRASDARDGRSARGSSSSSSNGSRSTTIAPRSSSPTRASSSARTTSALERRYRPHLLSGPEEKIVSELSLTGRGAWSRLFDELTSAIRVDLPEADEPVQLDVALSNLFDPDRERRRSVAEAVTKALEPGLRTRAYAFNTLLQEKSTIDRLRSYPHWLATRNLSNEASDESVQALIEAVRGRNELARALVTGRRRSSSASSALRLRPDGGRRRRTRNQSAGMPASGSCSRPSTRSRRE